MEVVMNTAAATRAVEIYNRLCDALHSDTRITKQSLARALNCSEKTIQRDLETLGEHFPGVQVDYDERLKTFFLAQDGVTGDEFKKSDIKIRLQNHDLFILLMSTHILSQYRDSPAFVQMQESLKRIAAQIPGNIAVITHQALARSLTTLAKPLRPVDPAIFDIVKQGIESKAVLAITYRAPDGKTTDRRIDPLYLDNMDGDLYTIAWCHLRKEVRIFALSRMTIARKTATSFTPDDHPEIRHYLENRFGIFMNCQQREYTIRLRFTADQTPYVRERTWHPKQKLVERATGEVDLSFPATHLFEVTRWVLSWGPGVRALAPPALVSAVRDQLTATLAQYEGK